MTKKYNERRLFGFLKPALNIFTKLDGPKDSNTPGAGCPIDKTGASLALKDCPGYRLKDVIGKRPLAYRGFALDCLHNLSNLLLSRGEL